jgi:uncharacterized membrane protein YwaF
MGGNVTSSFVDVLCPMFFYVVSLSLLLVAPCCDLARSAAQQKESIE